MKLIRCSGDPEGRSILTEYFQPHFLVASCRQCSASVRTACTAGDLHVLTHKQLFKSCLFNSFLRTSKNTLPRFVWVKVSIDLEIIIYIHKIITDFTVH